MPVNDELGKRMKENYEMRSRTSLMRREPVAIRIDGKAFHTFTKGLKRPFDDILMLSMKETMLDLCKNIQGCVFGYTQSDEITLILIDYQTLTTDAWFDYEVQKITSISASMATLYFNQHFAENVDYWVDNYYQAWHHSDDDDKYLQALDKCCKVGAMFDARCFNIPKEEVCNLIYWRQLDATRNSIQMVGQTFFSHKQLQNKTCNNIQDMLMEEYKINWNNYSADKKRGTACFRDDEGHWNIDNPPILKGENRYYVEKHIYLPTDNT